MIKSDIIVSICCTTYNHVNYIEDCIESIINQKTNFAFEICIGEDESDDGTREICIDYKKKYPKIINLFLRNRSDVLFISGQPTGRSNFINTLKQCKGKYIAICEGDDYWTDLHKLQKQVDFLEKNPDYVLIGSKADVLIDKKIHKSNQPNTSKVVEKKDLLYENPFAALTTMFRNIKITFPDFYKKYYAGDVMLFCFLSDYGLLMYDNYVTGVYRVHDKGISKRVKPLNRIISKIKMNIDLNNYFNNVISEDVRKINANYALISLKNHYKSFTFLDGIFLIKTYFRGML